MATITPTSVSAADRGVRKHTWTPLTEADDGKPIKLSGATLKSVHVYGDFGTGGQVDIEGKLADGGGWVILKDLGGSALSFTAEDINSVRDLVESIRPKVSAGTSVSLTVVMLTAI